MSDLASKHCVPCEGGVSPMPEEEIKKYLTELGSGWEYVNGQITKVWKFADFKEAMLFVNRVADIAETEGHHPNIHIFWNKVRCELYTHAIRGLSENDFILAAKIEALNHSQSA